MVAGPRGATLKAMALPQFLPVPASRPPALHLVPAARETSDDQPPLPLEDGVAADPPATPGLDPDADRAVRRLCVVVAEVLTRRRPVAQAATVLHPGLSATVEHLVRSRAAEGYRVASVRLQAPRPDAVEAAIRLVRDGVSRAVAVRVERAVTRWRCTALEAGLTNGPSRACRDSA